MSRVYPSGTIQERSRQLRNGICRLTTPVQMAEVSSHLRNFAVAEAIGFIALLDGHPQITGRAGTKPAGTNGPDVATAGAGYQQTRGKTSNPLAHAIPANLLLNGTSLARWYASAEARAALERVFGMGVMAPDDWALLATFEHDPRQHNIVDAIAERHHYGDGLVAAFRACGVAAVARGRWDGSGTRRHDLASLTRCIGDVYARVWVPRARTAYADARAHFGAQVAAARAANSPRLRVLTHRAAIVATQLAVLERETAISPEAARNVWRFAAAERWP